MIVAKIFAPLRSPPPAMIEEPEASPRALFGSVEMFWPRADRMGAQPVTNTSPSGPLAANEANALTPQEQGWLALLEIVFDETGWPDA